MLERIKSKRLTMSELFSITVEIYKQNIKTILFVRFFIITPLFLFDEWIVSKTNLDYLYSGKLDMTAEINAITSASLYKLVSSLVEMVIQPLANIAIIWGAVNIVRKQKSSANSNFLYSFSKAPAAILTTFLQAAFLFLIMFSFLVLGFSCLSMPSTALSVILFCIIIAICLMFVAYFTTIWAFADNVVTIQGLSGIKALMASKRAVQNYFKETFLYLLFFVGLSFSLGLGIESELNRICNGYPMYLICFAIWNFIHYATINSFFIVLMVVLFLNRIWKIEYTLETRKIEEEMEIKEIEKTKVEIKESLKEIEEKQYEVNLEKMSNDKQENDSNLEKTPHEEQSEEQENDDK